MRSWEFGLTEAVACRLKVEDDALLKSGGLRGADVQLCKKLPDHRTQLSPCTACPRGVIVQVYFPSWVYKASANAGAQCSAPFPHVLLSGREGKALREEYTKLALKAVTQQDCSQQLSD